MLLLDECHYGVIPAMMNNNNKTNRIAIPCDLLLVFLTYQLLIVINMFTIALTGDGGLGFDPGEGS